MVVFDFVCICMKTRKGKKMYLCCGDTLDSFVWKFDKAESCMFNTEEQAEKFAKNYFKNFQGWELDSYKVHDTDF